MCKLANIVRSTGFLGWLTVSKQVIEVALPVVHDHFELEHVQHKKITTKLEKLEARIIDLEIQLAWSELESPEI